MPLLSLQNLIAWAWQVCVIAALGAVLPLLFRIRHPRSRLLYCHSILLLALLLPVIQPWYHPVAISTTPTAVAATQPTTNTAPPPLTASIPAAFERVIFWLFVAGAAVKLAWLATGLWGIHRYRVTATPLFPLPEPVSKALGMTKAKGLFCISSKVKTPVTFGFQSPIVLQHVVTDGVHQMRLAETHAPVDVERVVRP